MERSNVETIEHNLACSKKWILQCQRGTMSLKSLNDNIQYAFFGTKGKVILLCRQNYPMIPLEEPDDRYLVLTIHNDRLVYVMYDAVEDHLFGSSNIEEAPEWIAKRIIKAIPELLESLSASIIINRGFNV